ncbi:hypothetical protein IVB44_21455 [Bradyrhizobium sp. 49]|uniref:hypothetical protein n=1 Tax=unclassified Bradyrhizobium TaxID=2631580 RepID=UPI001FFAB0A4|nr:MULTISPECIES: hypothetical protein [unclassified Bradyrhizobium]MCK1266747.1 hypothetical protein [Bradyrhizobium sp. 84]MCK1373534.1 hypothetical protein [Bradyrhizobium sp. 49]
MATTQDVTGANTALSFIDVLASALGAAVLLFVILASTPIAAPGRAQASGAFIRYEWTIVGDPGALLRISVKSPSGFTLIPIDEFSGQAVRKCGVAGAASYLLMGFARDAVAGPDLQGNDRTYVLRVNRPVQGDWQVGVWYYDRNSEIISSAPREIRITTAISHDSSATNTDDDQRGFQIQDAVGKSRSLARNAEVILKFGEQLFAPIVTERGKNSDVGRCS